MRVVAVVVTYNRLDMLKKCIESLIKQESMCDIFVVNNHSTDGTQAYLDEISLVETRIRHKDTGENIGGAGGFNFGMRWAVENGYDRVWIMDDDTFAKPNTLTELLNADEILEGEYGFLSSVALWTDGKECKMNRHKLKRKFFEFIELMQYGIVLCEQATFVSCFFSADTIKKAGLPIKEFFIWGDDIEYTRRLSVRMGMPCFVVGKSQVIHAMKENCGSSIAIENSERISRYNYAFRNENYLYRKEGIKGFMYYTAKCLVNILRVLCKAPNKKIRRCAIIIKNYFKGLWFNPSIEYVP